MNNPKHSAQCIAKTFEPAERWYAPQVTGYDAHTRLTWLRCNSPNCDATISLTEEELSSMVEGAFTNKAKARAASPTGE